jgi:hypothetical protein
MNCTVVRERRNCRLDSQITHRWREGSSDHEQLDLSVFHGDGTNTVVKSGCSIK